MILKEKSSIIQKILFGISFWVYFAASVILVKILLEQFALVKDVEGVEFIIKYLKMIGFVMLAAYAAGALILGIGFVCSIFNRLSFKKNAVIFSLFFVVEILTSASKLLFGGNISSFLLAIALPVMMLIVIINYFGRRKSKDRSINSVLCGVYTIYTIVLFVQSIGNYGSNIFSQANIILSLAKVFVGVLILFQIYAAEEKPKL